MTIRVLLVDDEELVRFGLRTVLEAAGDFEVVGEAGNGADGVAAARELKPDVVLTDIRMPVMDGLAATKRILALPDILECHRVAGGDSYLLKIRTKNTRSLDHLLVEQIRIIPGVYRTETTLILSSIKEDLALSVHAEQEPS